MIQKGGTKGYRYKDGNLPRKFKKRIKRILSLNYTYKVWFSLHSRMVIINKTTNRAILATTNLLHLLYWNNKQGRRSRGVWGRRRVDYGLKLEAFESDYNPIAWNCHIRNLNKYY